MHFKIGEIHLNALLTLNFDATKKNRQILRQFFSYNIIYK